jgi:hypothetical protein
MSASGSPISNAVPVADDFDNLDDTVAKSRSNTSRGITNRDKNVLTVAVSYNYELKIPFANWIIFEIWSASQVGLELTGAIWSSRISLGEAANGYDGANATGGGLIARKFTRLGIAGKVIMGSNTGNPERVFQKIRIPLANLWGLNESNVYIIPIYGSYSMRMHSNVFKSNLSEKLEQTLMTN